MHNKKKHGKKKHGLALAISFGLLMVTAKGFSQTTSSLAASASGEVLKTDNQFKKAKIKTAKRGDTAKPAHPSSQIGLQRNKFVEK